MKNRAVSVRFSEAQDAILKKIADAYDVTDVAVVRWAIKSLGVYFDAHGQLPPMIDAPRILEVPRPAQSKSGAGADSDKTRKVARQSTA